MACKFGPEIYRVEWIAQYFTVVLPLTLWKEIDLPTDYRGTAKPRNYNGWRISYRIRGKTLGTVVVGNNTEKPINSITVVKKCWQRVTVESFLATTGLSSVL